MALRHILVALAKNYASNCLGIDPAVLMDKDKLSNYNKLTKVAIVHDRTLLMITAHSNVDIR